jgi:hypothetical protein
MKDFIISYRYFMKLRNREMLGGICCVKGIAGCPPKEEWHDKTC